MSRLFNTDAMDRLLIQYHLANDKLPLGILSKLQIANGFKLLIQIGRSIKHNPSDKGIINSLSNDFYKTIPHNFGLKSPKPIDDSAKHSDEWLKLKNIENMQITYNIIENSKAIDENILDYYYKNLEVDIIEIDKECDIFSKIFNWVENTHGDFHEYKVKVQNIYHIERHEDKTRFAPFEEDTNANRRLLFHGSHVTNLVGIIRNGLQIKPEGIQTSGSMFGNGIQMFLIIIGCF